MGLGGGAGGGRGSVMYNEKGYAKLITIFLFTRATPGTPSSAFIIVRS